MNEEQGREKATLLIVDDDADNLESYSMGFSRRPYRLLTAGGGARALEILRNEEVDVVLTDLKMPDVDGLEVVRAAAALPAPPVPIVITAYGTIESAVEAMRLGAFDYVTKPVNLLELRAKVEKALEVRSLRVRNRELQGLLADQFAFEGVVGTSGQMREVIEQARLVARSRASVLIEGESGTGKDLVARSVHFNSSRRGGPFVPIHCAAIPETLLESELFGYEKGAFTGAHQRRIGQFESADAGTVFLDELSEIPLPTQVKLLRVLEQREITRVGSTKPIPIDIRLVAATNKNLAREVEEGRFREDLYYRLNVVRICMPPLRDRREDISLLVSHFLKEFAKENNRPPLRVAPAALDRLMRAPWPGNIRQLRNVVEQIVVFAQSDLIKVADLPAFLRVSGGGGEESQAQSMRASQQATAGGEAVAAAPSPSENQEGMSLADLERNHILRTLEGMEGNRTRTARVLGISRRTLQRKLKELGVSNE
ncbi:MAG TPA: sigma-54 dependent transcriptional regulator [Sumerlaeia bacterium]|nr:sigma-54 dependent transcriptional regulator [Sumerlaeia bacterium]